MSGPVITIHPDGTTEGMEEAVDYVLRTPNAMRSLRRLATVALDEAAKNSTPDLKLIPTQPKAKPAKTKRVRTTAQHQEAA